MSWLEIWALLAPLGSACYFFTFGYKQGWREGRTALLKLQKGQNVR